MGALKWYNPSTEEWEYVDQPGGANSWVFKEAISGVDGTQTVFTTARGYIPGTLQVFVNGIAQGPTHIVETSPNLGTFTLDTAPSGGDVVTVNYQINIPPNGNADTLDGFHASQLPLPNSIPVLDSSGMLPAHSAMGVIDVSTTGNKTVTGLPFKPKYVVFHYGRNSSTSFWGMGMGFMNETLQRAQGGQFRLTAHEGAFAKVTDRCMHYVNQANIPTMSAEKVSLNDDGFTINVLSTDSGISEGWWQAHS